MPRSNYYRLIYYVTESGLINSRISSAHAFLAGTVFQCIALFKRENEPKNLVHHPTWWKKIFFQIFIPIGINEMSNGRVKTILHQMTWWNFMIHTRTHTQNREDSQNCLTIHLNFDYFKTPILISNGRVFLVPRWLFSVSIICEPTRVKHYCFH